jgi:hypothetical protein
MAGSETINRNFLLRSTSCANRFAAAYSRLGGSLDGLSAFRMLKTVHGLKRKIETDINNVATPSVGFAPMDATCIEAANPLFVHAGGKHAFGIGRSLIRLWSDQLRK